MHRLLPLSGFLIAIFFAGPAHSGCDREWVEIFSDGTLSHADKLRRWEQLSPDCGGDATYDHRLAQVYSESGRFDEAERIIRQSIGKHNDPGTLAVLEYDLIDIERARVFSGGVPDAGILKEVREKFLGNSEKYKDHAMGYSAAAGLSLLLDEPEKAEEYSKKAINIEPDYLAYRSLAIASAQLGKFNRAVDTAVSASELNPGFRRDIDLMMSVAYAYISMDDARNAKALLGALLQERPDVKQQEQFNRLVVFVYQRAEELENPGE